MADKLCDKCGETVDEAKAFCPGCGNAFVDEERRQDVSEFDRLDSTVQLGKTMYGQMLSDMGLNISKAPNADEKRVEVIAPIAAPPAAAAATAKTPDAPIVKPKAGSNLKWFILGGIVILIGLFIVSAVVAIVFVNWPRLR